jgi:hypothetical protein
MADESLIECFSVVIAAQALEGKDGGLSLINLLDGVGVPAAALGQLTPFQILVNWTLGTQWDGKEFEVSVVAAKSDGSAEFQGQPLKVKVEPTSALYNDGLLRIRMRVQGFQLPPEFGPYKIYIKWRREPEDAWTASDAYCWINLSEVQLPGAAQAAQ